MFIISEETHHRFQPLPSPRVLENFLFNKMSSRNRSRGAYTPNVASPVFQVSSQYLDKVGQSKGKYVDYLLSLIGYIIYWDVQVLKNNGFKNATGEITSADRVWLFQTFERAVRELSGSAFQNDIRVISSIALASDQQPAFANDFASFLLQTWCTQPAHLGCSDEKGQDIDCRALLVQDPNVPCMSNAVPSKAVQDLFKSIIDAHGGAPAPPKPPKAAKSKMWLWLLIGLIVLILLILLWYNASKKSY